MTLAKQMVMSDGSALMIEALVQAGASAYVGYPITPANALYSYAGRRFENFMAAPDEISALQWASGFSATGKLPVVATSFPGFALMIESINMAVMMELPMVIILAQKLGPSTGSATTGAQGDVLLLRGMISGGYPVPVYCPSTLEECWTLAAESVKTALKLRTPVILLTSKEMIMTTKSFDLAQLPAISRQEYPLYKEKKSKSLYHSYFADSTGTPDFLPVGNGAHQVRLNASTHDADGMIQKVSPAAMANTKRLYDKVNHYMNTNAIFEHQPVDGSDRLMVSYGISAESVRESAGELNQNNARVSTLIVKSLLPVPSKIYPILKQYKEVVVVEENIDGAYCSVLFGSETPAHVKKINQIGRMISPAQIGAEVLS